MSDQREPNEDDERKVPPKPADAPIETPEADPRTQGAPDPDERSVSPDQYEKTQGQIQEAFE